MPPQTAQTLLSAEQFQALPDNGRDQELVQGEIRQMPRPGPRHADLSGELYASLRQFTKRHGGGKVLPECGFILERNPDTLRAPDLAVLREKDVEAAKELAPTEVAPAIAIEVNSPHDVAGEVADKARWWLGHGVEQVWIVDDPTRTVTVYYPDGSAQMLGEDQTLDAGHALPGFTLPLTNLFAT